jgi:hypothetical protein
MLPEYCDHKDHPRYCCASRRLPWSRHLPVRTLAPEGTSTRCSICPMDIANKQSLAWARFQALLSHPLSSGDESEVSQFHEIVSALEEAFNVDLSSFRIPEAELKQSEDESGSTAWEDAGRRAPHPGRYPARKQMSDKRFCDVHFLQRQIDGIALYFQNLRPAPKRQNIGF